MSYSTLSFIREFALTPLLVWSGSLLISRTRWVGALGGRVVNVEVRGWTMICHPQSRDRKQSIVLMPPAACVSI